MPETETPRTIRCSECCGECVFPTYDWSGPDWEDCRTCQGHGRVSKPAHWWQYLKSYESVPWALEWEKP